MRHFPLVGEQPLQTSSGYQGSLDVSVIRNDVCDEPLFPLDRLPYEDHGLSHARMFPQFSLHLDGVLGQFQCHDRLSS